MINVGIIGFGYWGPNLARNFAESDLSRIAAISDLRAARLDVAAQRYSGIKVTQDHRDLIRDPQIDAVAIATPVSTHFELAQEALLAGKHVLVEKPFTSSCAQAERLIELAARTQRVLMVDHTFVYTGAVRKIADLVRSGELGRVHYYDSVRINLGLFAHDVNVLWDLAVHDLSIIDYVLGCSPEAVSATGMSHVEGGQENIAYLTLFFPAQLIAHIHVNWLAPVKIRRTLLGCSRKMLVYDELEGSEKIKVYDKGVEVRDDPETLNQLRIKYRSGDMWAPQIDAAEALRVEVREFVECIQSNRCPITNGESGLRILRVLEAATASMAQQGKLVRLGATGAAA